MQIIEWVGVKSRICTLTAAGVFFVAGSLAGLSSSKAADAQQPFVPMKVADTMLVPSGTIVAKSTLQCPDGMVPTAQAASAGFMYGQPLSKYEAVARDIGESWVVSAIVTAGAPGAIPVLLDGKQATMLLMLTCR